MFHQHPDLQRSARFNMKVNLIDGALFGLGMGFASGVTVVPLFVATLTDSTALISLLAAIHTIGWYLPQIITTRHVAGLRAYFPFVIRMTIHERWPFFALALLALIVPGLPAWLALILAFLFLTCQGLGGGFTATGWQSMIGKIIPPRLRGTFWGAQSSAGSLLLALGAASAGWLLEALPHPWNFAACFALAGVAMTISWFFLAMTREPETEPAAADRPPVSWPLLARIVRQTPDLRMFMLARILSFTAWMATFLYAVYGQDTFGIGPAEVGLMGALMTIMQAFGDPLLGWLGDRFGNKRAMAGGALILALSAFAALAGNSVAWLYAAFALAGIGHAACWAVAMSMTLDFGTEADRPYVIGLVNTVIGPALLVTSFFGGTLVDGFGYDVTFGLSMIGGLLTAIILLFYVREPRQHQTSVGDSPLAMSHSAGD
jgi:MFS family permease